MKPCCPKCGSVSVDLTVRAGLGACIESDCRYAGRASEFKVEFGTSKQGNTSWRNPVGLLPGGFDDNG